VVGIVAHTTILPMRAVSRPAKSHVVACCAAQCAEARAR
jgi:hypothetical protein